MQNVDRGITGSSLAGSAILLEIGAEYGIIETLQNSPVLDAATVSRSSGIKEPVIAAYLDSLSKAGIIEELDGHLQDQQPFRRTDQRGGISVLGAACLCAADQ